MSRKGDFSGAKPDAVLPKHFGAEDIRVQNHFFVVKPDHPDGRKIEMPEISCLQLLRLNAALRQFVVLDLEFRAINAKFFEGVSEIGRSSDLWCVFGSARDFLRLSPQRFKSGFGMG
jgi:hypothetical protein